MEVSKEAGFAKAALLLYAYRADFPVCLSLQRMENSIIKF